MSLCICKSIKIFKMKNKKINEPKEKDSELTDNRIVPNEELQNKKYNVSQKNIKKMRRLENNFMFWDLSGGLLGI